MKFGNGMGSVIKLSGNRRRPYASRVTVGWVDGKQKFQYIGYYATQSEALAALLAYNDGEMAVDASKITFAELFEKWMEKNSMTLTETNQRAYRNIFNKWCSNLHKRPFVSIKSDDIQRILNDCDKSKSFKEKVRSLFNQLYKYADERDICRKNQAQFVTVVSGQEQREGKPFTDEEIEALWKRSDEFVPAITLILIYSGMRINELLEMKLENVHLVDRYMIGGKKTKAGRDRVIPIADKVYDLVIKNLGKKNYALERKDKAVHYRWFYNHFMKLMKELGFEHVVHDTRHTTISKLHSAGVPEITIKKLVGHSHGEDVTARVYVHKTVEELRDAINQI